MNTIATTGLVNKENITVPQKPPSQWSNLTHPNHTTNLTFMLIATTNK